MRCFKDFFEIPCDRSKLKTLLNLETMGVPPFVGFQHWLSLNSVAVMIATMFHHSCLNFIVHVYAAAAPTLAVTKQLLLYILGEKQRLM